MRALLLFALLVAVFCAALALSWPDCAGPAGCLQALARNRWWLVGLIGGGGLLASVVLWRMYKREPPGD